MMFLRSLLFNVVLFGSGLFFSLCSQLLWIIAPSRILSMGILWAKLTLVSLRVLCGVRLRVSGLDHLPADGRMIVAAQHQSMLDIMVWLHLLPEPAFILKQELLKIPVFGSMLVPAGFIAVDRSGGAASLRRMVEQARAAVAAGRQIVIFPEGTRVAPGERGLIQPGVAALAKALNVAVLPASTNSGLRWARASFLKKPGDFYVKIHPAVPPSTPRQEMMARLEQYFYEDA